MGIPVLILGESGSGKSASMRNFTPDQLGIINVSGKPLPFRSKFKPFCSDNYQVVTEVIRKCALPEKTDREESKKPERNCR